MGRVIISPVGLSIFQGAHGRERPNVNLRTGQVDQIKNILRNLGEEAGRLSAELATLKALEVNPADQAVFLATDTDECERAANVNAIVAEEHFGLSVRLERIKSLVLDDVGKFKRAGIPALVQTMDRSVSEAFNHGREPLLSVSGGIKPVVPYVALYGMLRGVPIVYIFERTEDMVILPPLPIDFDWDGLAVAARAFAHIERETAIDRSHLEGLLGEHLPRMEGLFEGLGNQVTLSAFGLMLLESLRRAEERPVMLSPASRQQLQELRGADRCIVEAMLDRVRNPIARAHKRHTFRGTDLDVYKPGSTPHRLAYWAEGESVYVAEIYTSHDDYERHLPGRLRQHYQPRVFTPYHPVKGESLTEDPAADETVPAALRAARQLQKERDEARAAATRAQADCNAALDLAAQTERKLQEQARQMAAIGDQLAAVQARQQEMAAWSIGRRLRWALLRS